MPVLQSTSPTTLQCRSGTRYTPDVNGIIVVSGGPDLLDAYQAGYLPINSMGPNLTPATNGITAFAGGGQASAVPLTSAINRVTVVATAGDSVKLPTAAPGQELTVINAAAANAMDVFPATGDAINALSANAQLSVAANKSCSFFCAVAGKWQSQLTA